MRRLVLTLLVLVLAAPAAALAVERSSGDGSLVVSRAAVRTITVQGNGLVFGHFDQGVLTVVDYDPAGPTSPQISGAPWKIVGNVVKYTGSDVRFLFPTGRYTLRFEGVGIDISAVGKGTISAAGLGTGADGAVTVNGGKPQPLGFNGVAASFGKKEKDAKDAKERDNSGKGSSH